MFNFTNTHTQHTYTYTERDKRTHMLCSAVVALSCVAVSLSQGVDANFT